VVEDVDDVDTVAWAALEAGGADAPDPFAGTEVVAVVEPVAAEGDVVEVGAIGNALTSVLRTFDEFSASVGAGDELPAVVGDTEAAWSDGVFSVDAAPARDNVIVVVAVAVAVCGVPALAVPIVDRSD
jgi:hypothetical protein